MQKKKAARIFERVEQSLIVDIYIYIYIRIVMHVRTIDIDMQTSLRAFVYVCYVLE